MTSPATKHRVKKSYSLSGEAVAFVSKTRKVRKIGSDSETLDQLIHEAMEVQRKSKIDAAYRAYYDAASDAELAEDVLWADLSTAELPEVTR